MTNDNISTDDDEAKKTTPEDIREMEELLPPILRAYGAVHAKYGDSVDVLDGVHFMGLVYVYVYLYIYV